MALEPDFLGRGISLPFTVRNGMVRTSDGEDLVRESILIILGTAKGERVMRPDFGCGIQELIFAPNTASTATLVSAHVKEALQKWEPRIEVIDVRVSTDEAEQNRLNIDIEYRIRTTNTKRNLVYPFYLELQR
jgi:Bacteriophage baseplate protein W